MRKGLLVREAQRAQGWLLCADTAQLKQLRWTPLNTSLTRYQRFPPLENFYLSCRTKATAMGPCQQPQGDERPGVTRGFPGHPKVFTLIPLVGCGGCSPLGQKAVPLQPSLLQQEVAPLGRSQTPPGLVKHGEVAGREPLGLAGGCAAARSVLRELQNGVPFLEEQERSPSRGILG